MKHLCLIAFAFIFALAGSASASTIQLSVNPSSVEAGQPIQYQLSGEGQPEEVYQLSSIGCSSWSEYVKSASGPFSESNTFSAPQAPGTYRICAAIHPGGAQASATFTVTSANAPPPEGAGGLTNAPAPVTGSPKATTKAKPCKKPKAKHTKCRRAARRKHKRARR